MTDPALPPAGGPEGPSSSAAIADELRSIIREELAAASARTPEAPIPGTQATTTGSTLPLAISAPGDPHPPALHTIPIFSAPSSGTPPVLLPPSGAVSMGTGSASPLTSVVWSSGAMPSLPHPAPGTRPTAMTLASSLPPVPAKLVRRIQALDFIEMRELLPDNIALSERLEALPSHVARDRVPHQREVGSLLTWVSSFATYVAVLSQAHPNRVPDMLMYMRLIVREAQKFHGIGWLTYDSIFRQNNVAGETRWNVLDPSLHTAHIAQGGLAVVPCRLCSGVDHTPTECAEAPLQPEVRPTKPRQYLERGRSERDQRFTPAGSSARNICTSWNKGRCRFPGTCYFRHVCLGCGSDHMQKDCMASRPGQLPWQGSRGQPPAGPRPDGSRFTGQRVNYGQ